MLMFKRTFWRNHVEDQDGKVIQQGTLLEQDQFNRMEVGISDSNMAANIIHIMLLWFGRRLGVLETSSNSHDTDIASIKTLNGQQDTRLAAPSPNGQRMSVGRTPVSASILSLQVFTSAMIWSAVREL